MAGLATRISRGMWQYSDDYMSTVGGCDIHKLSQDISFYCVTTGYYCSIFGVPSFPQVFPDTMLACIPHTMSRKRKAIPFATLDYDLKRPLRKRTCREVDITSPSNSEEIKSLDLVVMSRPSRTRRLASVKAQIAVTSLLSAEHHRSRSSSPHNCTTEDEVLDKLPASLSTCARRPHSLFDEKITQNKLKRKGDSCNSSLSPLSSLGSEWDEEKVVESCWKVSHPNIKSPVLNLMPVVECTKIPAKPRAKKSVDPAKLNGYVRRMASLNARACVSAMMEPVRRPSKQKGLPSKSIPASATSPVCNPSESLSSSPRRVSPRRSPVPQPGVVTHSRHDSVEKEIFDGNFSPEGYVVVCGSPMTLKEYGIIRGSEYSETSNFNTEGLLWNGDTLHPQSRVYLTPDGSLPRLIVPPVCPVRPNCVQEAKALAKIPLPKKPRAVKVYYCTCMHYFKLLKASTQNYQSLLVST